MRRKTKRLILVILLVAPALFQNCKFVPRQFQTPPQSSDSPSNETIDAPPAVTENAPVTEKAPTLQWQRALTASWAGYAQDNSKTHVPIGWGYMDPMILVKDGQQYALSFSPCEDVSDPKFGKVQCLYLIRNGNEVLSELLSLGDVPGHTIDYAYQTPMLFAFGGELHVAYWAQTSTRSVIHVASVSLAGSVPLVWQHRAIYLSAENASSNYLGGAMASDGTLVLTGFTQEGESRRLDVFYSSYPYAQMNYAGPAANFASAHFTPLYSHVVVRPNGIIDIMTTLTNATACAETGATYTSYKNVVQYQGSLSGGFAAVWSDGAPDVAASPSTNGDNCYFNNSRFPLDLFHDSTAGTTFSIYKISNLKTMNPAARLNSNADYLSKIRLMSSSGGAIVDDLGKYFTSFAASHEIDSVTMTKLTTGEYVFIANGRYSLLLNKTNHLNIVTTKDFKTFSSTWVYSTPFGAGHSVKVAQPNKNGSEPSAQLDFFHGGDLYNPAGTIGYNQFRYYRFSF